MLFALLLVTVGGVVWWWCTRPWLRPRRDHVSDRWLRDHVYTDGKRVVTPERTST